MIELIVLQTVLEQPKTNNRCNGRDILNMSLAWHREETV